MKRSFDEIEKLLIEDEVSYGQAFELIKKLPKAWQTKEWKLKKKEIQKEHCEQCGDTDSILVIQHLYHPPEFREVRNAIFNELYREYQTQNPEVFHIPVPSKEELAIFEKEYVEERMVCPNCKKQSFSTRKGVLPKYRCNNYHCHLEFDNPDTINYIPARHLRLEENISLLDVYYSIQEINKYPKVKQNFYHSVKESIGKKALLYCIKLSKKYRDFIDTKTFCKPCATNMDLNGNLLCYGCKKKFFKYNLYDNCYDCYKKDVAEYNPFIEIIYSATQMEP